MNRLLMLSPLDGRYADKVKDLEFIGSEFGLIRYRLIIEIEWFKMFFISKEFGLPDLSTDDLGLLDKIVKDFDLAQAEKIKDIEKITNHDVKAVEYYIKDYIKSSDTLDKYREFIHFACTSEDINNLSYGLMIKDLCGILVEKIENIGADILHRATEYKDKPMMSRTHGQGATPSTMGKEFYNFYYRLHRQIKQLKSAPILGKINGAVGNYNAHVVSYPAVDWESFARGFVEDRLGLTFNPYTTQIEPHDYVAEIFDVLRRVNTILIDFSRDMWGYISLNYFKQKLVAHEVGSSTMPHKVNPIDFENGEGNLGLANAFATHFSEKLPISRFQRDLTDSTVQRNIGVAVGYMVLGIASIAKGISKLEINEEMLNHDLNNSWELLAEPIQMILRKHGVSDAYEKLKELTRGKKIDGVVLKEFINKLDLPIAERDQLLKLTPHSYIGLANRLF